MSKNNPTVKERITALEILIKELKEQFKNHLGHHWAIDLALLTALLGSIGTALILLRR